MNVLKVLHLPPVTFLAYVSLKLLLTFFKCSDIRFFSFYFSVWTPNQIVRLSSNSSITSWTPSNLEFASYVEIFMTSLPGFQIGPFFFFLMNSCFAIFMPVFVYQFLNFCFYGYYSSLTLFFPHFLSFYNFALQTHLEWNYSFPFQTTSVCYWFCGSFHPMTLFSASDQ